LGISGTDGRTDRQTDGWTTPIRIAIDPLKAGHITSLQPIPASCRSRARTTEESARRNWNSTLPPCRTAYSRVHTQPPCSSMKPGQRL